jgi:membrane-bound lytic murein transglycosylase D
LGGFRRFVAIPLLAFLLTTGSAAANPGDPFPEPEELRPAVAFWMRVYLESTTDGGFLHDARNLGVVYELVRFEGERDRRRRERMVDARKDYWRATLDYFALGGQPRGDAEREVLAAMRQALGREPQERDFKLAKTEIRFQLGQRDKFRDGLVRSGAYEDEMRAIFRDMGLPEDLAYLPHVESSFNVRAYSKYGAAGVWQFMRGTGRRFMKVDYVVDERLDPITATRAAGRLLRENYDMLRTWPLALTAYNHGAAGMNRAVQRLGTRDIEEIVARYDSRTFGFASRNFYAQFLAARRVMRTHESYFGPVERDQPNVVDVVALPFYANVADLERDLGVSRAMLADLNPALRPPVFRSGKRIPKGYALRLPAGTVKGDASTWLAAVPPAERHEAQHQNRYYTVRRGDTLGRIASRHGTSVSALVAENDIGRRHRIFPGQVLQLPERGARPEPEPSMTLVSEAMAATRPAVAPEPVPEKPVAKAEPAPAPTPAPAPPPAVAPAEEVVIDETVVAAVTPAVPPPAPQPSREPAPAANGPIVAVAPGKPAVIPSPQTAVQEAEVLLEAAPEAPATPEVAVSPTTPALPDDSPFRRIDRERVIVDADETLGHFADWLEVTPQRLRNLNKLRPKRQIQVGQTLRLDFSKVSPEEFQERRLEYHKGIEEDFFASFQVTNTIEHTLRPGETLWVLSHKTYAVPSWLIHRYNPDLNLAKLVPGSKLVIPIVEKSAG